MIRRLRRWLTEPFRETVEVRRMIDGRVMTIRRGWWGFSYSISSDAESGS